MGTTISSSSSSATTESKAVKSKSVTKGFKSPRYIKLSGNVKRAKFAINISVAIEAFSILLIGLLSIFRITTSDTFSLLALANMPHFFSALFAFFVARPYTMDLGVFTGFVSLAFIEMILDVGTVIWRHFLVQDCIDDSTPSNDCENHIIFSWIIIGLNYALIAITVIYLVTGIIIAAFSKPLLDQAKLLASTYESAWIAGGSKPQPIVVQVFKDEEGIIKVKQAQGSMISQRFNQEEVFNDTIEEVNSTETYSNALLEEPLRVTEPLKVVEPSTTKYFFE